MNILFFFCCNGEIKYRNGLIVKHCMNIEDLIFSSKKKKKKNLLLLRSSLRDKFSNILVRIQESVRSEKYVGVPLSSRLLAHKNRCHANTVRPTSTTQPNVIFINKLGGPVLDSSTINIVSVKLQQTPKLDFVLDSSGINNVSQKH